MPLFDVPADAKHLVFTGSSLDLPLMQRFTLKKVLQRLSYRYEVFHHGDCIGADLVAARIASYDFKRLECHPCNIDSMRAFTNFNHKVHQPLPPLKRNKVMVDLGHMLVACPRTQQEELRSGTWATVRYARKAGLPILFVWPDGSQYEEDDRRKL